MWKVGWKWSGKWCVYGWEHVNWWISNLIMWPFFLVSFDALRWTQTGPRMKPFSTIGVGTNVKGNRSYEGIAWDQSMHDISTIKKTRITLRHIYYYIINKTIAGWMSQVYWWCPGQKIAIKSFSIDLQGGRRHTNCCIDFRVLLHCMSICDDPIRLTWVADGEIEFVFAVQSKSLCCRSVRFQYVSRCSKDNIQGLCKLLYFLEKKKNY